MIRPCIKSCIFRRLKDSVSAWNLSSTAWFFILWFGGVFAVLAMSYGVKLLIALLKKAIF